MNARTRKLIAYGEDCGFTLDGIDGQGHYRMIHPNGTTVRVSGSPGDWKGDANCQAEMRRKSGVVPVRPNAARFTFKRQRGFSMRHALAEKDDSKSGEWVTESMPAENPRLAVLRQKVADLDTQIASTPYPYLRQERRRLEQLIAELARASA